jgi:hypothetical protein
LDIAGGGEDDEGVLKQVVPLQAFRAHEAAGDARQLCDAGALLCHATSLAHTASVEN